MGLALITHCPLCGYGPFPDGYGYSSVEEVRYSFDICDCCGCEYGYSDNEENYQAWVAKGSPWRDPMLKPNQWDLASQIPYQLRPWPPPA